MSKTAKVKVKKLKVKRDNTFTRIRKKVGLKNVDFPFSQIFHLQSGIVNQAVQRLFKSGTLQAKLKIGKPGDKYEKEADSMRVMGSMGQWGQISTFDKLDNRK